MVDITMNEIQRLVLQKHTSDIVRDIIITETLLGTMLQKNIFDQEMIEIIKAGRTHSEQIYKMLELLPKRGPDAFDSFYEILQDQYPWIAKPLHESLTTENEKILALQSKKDEINCERLSTPKGTEAHLNLDADIRVQVSAFVQKQFGQVRRISNSDKKAIEWWMGKWLQTERKRITKVLEDAYKVSQQGAMLEQSEVKQEIVSLYTHIITKKKSFTNLKVTRNNIKDTEAINEDESINHVNQESEKVIQDINFNLLRNEIDEIFTKVVNMEKQINRSLDYLDGKKSQKELSILVHELCSEYRYKERELVQERQKIEKMLGELYNNSTKMNKQQSIINLQEHEIISLKDEINKHKNDNISLIKEITELEKQRLIHIEKEKTLAELKKTREDLQVMIQVVNKENKELKEHLQAQLKTGVRGFQNRRPLNNSINNLSRVSPKKTSQKKRSSSFKT